MTRERRLAYFALLVTAIIWGVAPPVIKYTLRYITPTAFLLYRLLIASLIVAIPLCLKLIKQKPSSKTLLLYLFLGFLCTPLNLLLLFWGIQRTSSIDASLISIISPILVVLGGAIFLKERVMKTERIGIAVTLVGTILTVVQPIFEYPINFKQNLYGNFLVLLGTLVWVIFTLLTKKIHREKLDSFLLSGISFWIGVVVIYPLFFYERWVYIDFLKSAFLPTPSFYYLDPRALPGILFMAVFSSVIAYFAYVYGLTKIEASEATIFTYLQPLFSVPLAVVLLNEKITFPFIIGAVLITFGVFVCEFRQNRTKIIE